MLGYVCTNYNNSGYTRGAVASLHASGRGSEVRVVIVDNASSSEDVAELRRIAADFPGVEVLAQPKNLGYFPGLNVGIRHLRATAPEIPHLVIGNNDLLFPSGFLAMVERNAAVLEKWAVVAPDLVTPEGVHQNPHVLHPIGGARRFIWDLYYAAYPLGTLIKWGARTAGRLAARPENRAGSTLYQQAGPIEQGYGACYLLGPAFFRHFAALAAPTFLMQEEYFLSEQLQGIGQQTWYEPGIVVQHVGHATMGQMQSRRHWEIARTAHRTYKRYLAMGPAERSGFLAMESGGLA